MTNEKTRFIMMKFPDLFVAEIGENQSVNKFYHYK